LIRLQCYIVDKNGASYLRLNQHGTPETCIKKNAQVFEEEKALKLLKAIPRTMKRFKFQIVPVEDFKAEPKKTKEEGFTSNVFEPFSDPLIQRWVEKANNLNGLVEEMDARYKELDKLLCKIGSERQDVLHKIEFEKMDAVIGWKRIRQLQEIQRKRRLIKDEMLVLSIIMKQDFGSILSNELQEKLQAASNMTYKPRVLTELF